MYISYRYNNNTPEETPGLHLNMMQIQTEAFLQQLLVLNPLWFYRLPSFGINSHDRRKNE